MGKGQRYRNSTYRKKFHRKLNEKWTQETRARMQRLLGMSPVSLEKQSEQTSDNSVKESDLIDGRDWRLAFPESTKWSGFDWHEFARRSEKATDKRTKETEKMIARKARDEFDLRVRKKAESAKLRKERREERKRLKRTANQAAGQAAIERAVNPYEKQSGSAGSEKSSDVDESSEDVDMTADQFVGDSDDEKW